MLPTYPVNFRWKRRYIKLCTIVVYREDDYKDHDVMILIPSLQIDVHRDWVTNPDANSDRWWMDIPF